MDQLKGLVNFKAIPPPKPAWMIGNVTAAVARILKINFVVQLERLANKIYALFVHRYIINGSSLGRFRVQG